MKIENQQKLLAIIAISGVALLACDRLVFSPLLRVWKDRSEHLAELSKRIGQGTVLLERARTIEDRWDSMRTNTLPMNASEAEGKVMKALDRWVRDSGITFTSLKPQWKQNDDYTTLECRADGTGDILAVSRFLYELEKDPLPLRVEDFEIATRDSAGQQLTLGVRFTALVLPPATTP